jgi:EAL domain-containing protein (putative c-di-GMP-specific phosphodiesterase class I)
MGAQAVRLSNVDIDNALKNKDFEVLFQPIFDLATGAFARVEGFVRWRHRALGVLPPGAFISYFETQGRMSELTRYVLDRALADYLAWRGPAPPGFSINLALSDLADDGFANHLSVHLRDRGIAPELITLECPMPPVTMDIAEAAAHFERLSETGVRLAIEVRGRANDFLKTIDPFPFDEIKTGGAAILRFARTVRGPGLSAIAELLEIAKKARSAIVAVGVEDQASLAALRSLGFTAAQGNHLAQVGALANLPFEKVNEVRPLLGLAALDEAEIAAMAKPPAGAEPRKQKSSPRAAVTPPPAPEKAVEAKETIERLNARIARQNETPQDDDRARIRAALGAQKGSALTKAAAIAKAKRKGGAMLGGPGDAADEDPGRDSERAAFPAPDPTPARRLLDRLSKAFDRTESHAPASAAAVSDEDEFAEASAAPEAEQPDQAGTLARMKDESQTTTRAQDQRLAQPVSLPIGAARAYFRPAVYVAAAPIQTVPDAPSRAADSEDIVEFRIDDTPPAALVSKAGPELRDPAPLAPPQIPPADAPHTDDRAIVVAPTASPAAHRPHRRRHARKKPKSFLQRRFYISHFWPRSWKRWWTRRTAGDSAGA